MSETRFDTESFIHAVQERPCLWDLSCNDYINRVHKKQAWDELTMLFGGKECNTPEEKTDLCKYIRLLTETIKRLKNCVNEFHD